MKHFNDLTPGEAKRLAILAEECAEVIQVIGKILRHGYESHHPDTPAVTNRSLLEVELGDIEAIKTLMYGSDDVSGLGISAAKQNKLERILKYTHHQQSFGEPS